jgi:hypothetical protein
VVASLFVVPDEGIAIQFTERHRLVTNTDFLCDSSCVLEFGSGKGLAFRGTRNGIRPECVVGEPGDNARVDAAREGNENAVSLGEIGTRSRQFLLYRLLGHGSMFVVRGERVSVSEGRKVAVPKYDFFTVDLQMVAWSISTMSFTPWPTAN